jgi:hypothetical protein
MPRGREPSRGGWSILAAAALLLASAGGCNLGSDRLRCTLDPASIGVSQPQAVSWTDTVPLGGTAFPYGECGVPCPPPWNVTVRWRNLTTGDAGEVPGTYQAYGCWPFAAVSCQGAFWSVDVPLAPGINRVELEADEGDGFTACQLLEVERISLRKAPWPPHQTSTPTFSAQASDQSSWSPGPAAPP